MYSACCLMVLYICVKFRENITNLIRDIEWTQVHGRNGYVKFKRVITPNIVEPELQFMCSAHCLMVLYIGVKFLENISNSIRFTERADTKL